MVCNRDNGGSKMVGTPPSRGATTAMDSHRREREGVEQHTNIQLAHCRRQ